jgi:hypothetical protein
MELKRNLSIGLRSCGRGSGWELGWRAGLDVGMPTVLRRPAAQRERDRLEAHRLRAGKSLAIGVRQVEVASQFRSLLRR